MKTLGGEVGVLSIGVGAMQLILAGVVALFIGPSPAVLGAVLGGALLAIGAFCVVGDFIVRRRKE
jgi:hypothetical protein